MRTYTNKRCPYCGDRVPVGCVTCTKSACQEAEFYANRARNPPPIYCTTYCNKGHRTRDGKPVGHECHIIPPKALRLEIAGDFDKAIAELAAAQPLPISRGVRS